MSSSGSERNGWTRSSSRGDVKTTGFAVDSNCLVAIVSDWHAAQESATREVDERMAAGETLLLPAHAIAEAFSVLTRLPADKRLTPAEAWRLLETNFVSEGRVVALDATVYPALFARAASAGIAGGRVYDLIIAETASRAAASALVTLNPKHFPSPPPGLRIVDPTARPDSGWNDHS